MVHPQFMVSRQPRYPREEFSRRGKEIYEAKIRPVVEEEANIGKIVAIDIETGEYAMDVDGMVACDRLRERLADPQIFCMRVGYETALWFGGQSKRIETWSKEK